MKNLEHQKDLQLGRRVLGIGWPGEKPGLAVVIAEEEYPMIGRKDYQLHFLEEVEAQDLDALFNKCAEIIKKYGISEVYGRRDKDYRGNLYSWNKRHPGAEFDVRMAPHSKDGKIGFHINILIERLKSGMLNLPEDSKIRNQFNDVKQGQTHLATDMQFPAVAALGYVVARLTEYPSEIEQEVYEYLDYVDPTTGY